MPASIGGVLSFVFLIGRVLGLPEVENPIPEKIGLEDVFALAGAGGVLGGIAMLGAPSAMRDQGIQWGVFVGFCFGAAAYCLLLLIQVLSVL